MRKRLRAALLGLAAIASMALFAPQAQAHYTGTEAGAIQTTANAWGSGWCGNGLTWVCLANPHSSSTARHYGSHSWFVYYAWHEYRPGNSRICWAQARVEHGWVVQTYGPAETCN